MKFNLIINNLTLGLLGSLLSIAPAYGASIFFRSVPPPQQDGVDPILDIYPFKTGDQVTFEILMNLNGLINPIGKGPNVKVSVFALFDQTELAPNKAASVFDAHAVFETTENPIENGQANIIHANANTKLEGAAAGGLLELDRLVFTGVNPKNDGIFDFRIDRIQVIDETGKDRTKEFDIGVVDLLGNPILDPNAMREVEVQCDQFTFKPFNASSLAIIPTSLLATATCGPCGCKVPEPASVLGLIGLGIFGTGSLLKMKKKLINGQ